MPSTESGRTFRARNHSRSTPLVIRAGFQRLGSDTPGRFVRISGTINRLRLIQRRMPPTPLVGRSPRTTIYPDEDYLKSEFLTLIALGASSMPEDLPSSRGGSVRDPGQCRTLKTITEFDALPFVSFLIPPFWSRER